jgi:NADH-quinone oxidoreductase subunit J
MLAPMLFYILAFLLIIFALGVLLSPNPIFSSLYLAGTMIVLSAVYYVLQVPFIAAVQLMVYAGAVMILFVMVLMMFDLSNERQIFSKGLASNALKIGLGGYFAFTLFTAIFMSTEMISNANSITPEVLSTKLMAESLFKEYLVEFELLGLILLLVAIGAVTMSRIKGGTHANS